MPGGEGGGTAFYGKSPTGGGPPRQVGGGGSSGREGVRGEFGGEGAKYFFFGAEIPAKTSAPKYPLKQGLN